MTPTRRTIELCAGHAKRHYAVQAAQTLNVDTAVPQYRHSYIIYIGRTMICSSSCCILSNASERPIHTALWSIVS